MAEPDLAGILASLSKEDMEGIKSLAGSLLGGGKAALPASSAPEATAAPAAPAASEAPRQENALSSLLPALSGLTGSGAGLPDLGLIQTLAPILSALGTHDERTDFIQALKPLLSEERRKKADEAAKLLRLITLLPLLKDSGIF